jgi:hypothetical protein
MTLYRGSIPEDKEKIRIWKVYGENRSEGAFNSAPNIPYLGIVKGSFTQVLEWAKSQPKWCFYKDSAGGEIIEFKIPTDILDLTDNSPKE